MPVRASMITVPMTAVIKQNAQLSVDGTCRLMVPGYLVCRRLDVSIHGAVANAQ